MPLAPGPSMRTALLFLASAAAASFGCSAAGSSDAFDNPNAAHGNTAGTGGAGQPTDPGGAAGAPESPGTSEDELCDNGLDDNRNGFIDEGCACEIDAAQPCFAGESSLAGKGICTFGSQVCLADSTGEFTGSHWGPCENSGIPVPETCDSTDNDCDGTVDNGCTCSPGDELDCATACGPGVQLCDNGVWTDCNAPQPAVEICDGTDNDCNGLIDENLAQPCTSTCGSGVRVCDFGVWGPCNAPTDCGDPCQTIICQGDCCPGGSACCDDGSCPDVTGQCPVLCPTVECEGTCCPTGTQCCWNGACPDSWGGCPPQCGTFECQGICCPAGNGCCTNGACPDANGNCPSTCPTIVCDGTCCPAGTQCCNNGACPDPATGQCDSETDQCQGKPEAEVYAHSGFTLYRIDPDTKAIVTVGGFSGCGGYQMIDIAMDKDGQIYGTTTQAVARINKQTGACTVLASGGGNPNSLSFVPEGTVFPNSEALVGYSLGDYVVIDTQNGTKTKIGELPAGYFSSGDLVSIAGVGTFLTVNGNGCSDCILEVDASSGAMIQNLGPVGYPLVYGLAFWKGDLYGFTKGGALFTFDLSSHVTTLVPMPGAPSSLTFNGAGSTTCAPGL